MPPRDPLLKRLKQEQQAKRDERHGVTADFTERFSGLLEATRQRLEESGRVAFDPKAHMSKLKGKDYLEVKWRLVWFREEHPADSGWGITTEIVHFDEKLAAIKACIVDPEGRVVANGIKQEQPAHFSDYLEKAETGAIGRALAALGYGTQFAPELEEGERIVDSPVISKPNTNSQPTPPPKQEEPAAKTAPSEDKHPNKTPVTTALTKSIYITGGKCQMDNDAVKAFARTLLDKPDLVSLYDLGKEQGPYKDLLMALNAKVGGN